MFVSVHGTSQMDVFTITLTSFIVVVIKTIHAFCRETGLHIVMTLNYKCVYLMYITCSTHNMGLKVKRVLKACDYKKNLE